MKPDKPPTFPVKYKCMFCGGVHDVTLRDFMIVIAVNVILCVTVILRLCGRL